MSNPCLTRLVHLVLKSTDGLSLQREAVRAIVQRGDEILLLYTRRYDDYSFPGGGVESGEDQASALHRELAEETGASDIQILRPYGFIDEYRPSPKPEFDFLFMRSHFYLCQIAEKLGQHAMESYEIHNGMEPRWLKLEAALAHNEALIAQQSAKIGLSIWRETWMLRHLTEMANCLV